MAIRYDYAGAACSGKEQPGTRSLLNVLVKLFPGSSSAGIYNCRSIRGSSARSLHSEGRALDIHPKTKAQGDAIREYVFQQKEYFQIQEIIWQRQIWSAITPHWHPYNGVNPHTDHLHIGLNWDGAKGVRSNTVVPVVRSTEASMTPAVLLAALAGIVATYIIE